MYIYHMKETEDKQKLLDDFLEKPTTYHVHVINNESLPEKLKGRESISFIVKPPTIHTLAMMGKELMGVDKDIFDAQKVDYKDAIKYSDVMIKVFCIISHAQDTPYPEWYEPFLLKNLTAKELFLIFQEVAVKSQTGFFLNSLKMLDVTNPMMMKNQDPSASTPTDS